MNDCNQNRYPHRKTPGEPKLRLLRSLSVSAHQRATKAMVRKGGFEPPRLSAPPPQDGVSANSTTSAICDLPVINRGASSSGKGLPLHPILHRLLALDALSGRHRSASRSNNLRTAHSHGRSYHIVVTMLSCPATSCNVNGPCVPSGRLSKICRSTPFDFSMWKIGRPVDSARRLCCSKLLATVKEFTETAVPTT